MSRRRIHISTAKQYRKEYDARAGMIRRCYDSTRPEYPGYGARGIRVCDRWLHGADGMTAFDCFLIDMGPAPSPQHSIDRINNDGNYCHENCRWATKLEQARNKRRSASSTCRFVGVYYEAKAKAWHAQIKIGGKSGSLGRFQTAVEAAIRYDRESFRIRGVSSLLNFPERFQKSPT